ncbi:MAG: efflux RND transporter periplasmic adaptor subunit [Aureispira sp.]|nr:efflux RND transporter periplasmic adaptor subunit [Aureispira sp.]
MNIKKLIIPIALVVLCVVAYFLFAPKQEKQEEILTTKVTKGEIEVTVTASGELKAKNSEKILAPSGLQSVRIYQLKIENIVPEGTIVKEGAFVASLDRSEISTKISDVASEIEKIESQLDQEKLDTAISLRELRDGIQNLLFNIKEKELELEQSIYEPPAITKKLKLEIERIERDLNQKDTNYKLRKQQAEAKIREVIANLSISQRKQQNYMEMAGKFNIMAPKSGMLIYHRSWNGEKIKAGSQVSAWNPIVATLPDLTDMISICFVNEIDINKVKENQKVTVKVDAFPDKEYKGTVTKIANIGERRPHLDANEFEIEIQIEGSDSILRPAMTTENTIHISVTPDLLTVPIECVQGNDSLAYVFLNQDGNIVKKEILTGISNTELIEIKEGLKENQEIYLVVPTEKEGEEYPIVRLPQDILDKEKERKEQERQKRLAEERARKEKANSAAMPSGMPPGMVISK